MREQGGVAGIGGHGERRVFLESSNFLRANIWSLWQEGCLSNHHFEKECPMAA